MSDDELKSRVQQFAAALELLGQPQMMHIGTSYLVNDLWQEVVRLRALLEEVKVATAVPLPDPNAHSWSAFYTAAYDRLSRCINAARRM